MMVKVSLRYKIQFGCRGMAEKCGNVEKLIAG